jgi:hypothetical protein
MKRIYSKRALRPASPLHKGCGVCWMHRVQAALHRSKLEVGENVGHYYFNIKYKLTLLICEM